MLSRRAAITGSACAALLILVYLAAVWTRTGQRFEDAVLHAALGGRQEAAAGILDSITAWSITGAVVVVFLIGRHRGGLPLGLAGSGVIVASVLTTELLQHVLPRPLLLQHGYRREDHSFPSGHAAIAMAVMCGLVLVVPYRLRGLIALLTSLGAVGVGALTVTASWHRPSDTIGSDLIVLGYACAAIALLARRGSVRRAEPPAAEGRAARTLLIALIGCGALIASGYGMLIGYRVNGQLAALAVWDPDLAPHAALTAGRAITISGGGLVTLALLLLLRDIELRPEERRRSFNRRSGDVRRAEPTSPRTGRAR